MIDPKMMGGMPRAEAAEELDEEFENPSAMNEAPELLVPASMFPKGCKEGDTYFVKGTVGKMGSKVAFTPTEAFKPGVPSTGEESAQN